MGHAEKLFRIRVGKFRVLYRVDYINYLIVIIKIDSRDKDTAFDILPMVVFVETCGRIKDNGIVFTNNG